MRKGVKCTVKPCYFERLGVKFYVMSKSDLNQSKMRKSVFTYCVELSLFRAFNQIPDEFEIMRLDCTCIMLLQCDLFIYYIVIKWYPVVYIPG